MHGPSASAALRRRCLTGLAVLASLAVSATATAQGTSRLTFKNNCTVPVWLELENNSDTPGVPVLPRTPPGGARNILPLAAGEGPVTVTIPAVGWAGRFFPKLGCNAQTGNDCQGGQALNPCPAGGCQPAATTKIEFNYANLATSRDSWYDISLVDGYNLAARITPSGPQSGSCTTTSCSLSLAACPRADEPIGSLLYAENGTSLWCYSPCTKWTYPTYGGLGRPNTQAPGSAFCCPNRPVSSEECNAGAVVRTEYVTMIRRDCPSAYSFAFDDEGGNHNCPTATAFDVVLCP
jgi:hypothetical protein